MKNIDIFRLSFKNLFDNFSRSVFTLITITLLSFLVTSMSDFLYCLNKSIDNQNLNNLKVNKIDLSLSINYDSIKKLDNKDIKVFLDNSSKLINIDEYLFQFNRIDIDDADNDIILVPHLGDAKNENEFYNYNLISGENCTKQDIGKNNIWLSKEYSEKNNIKIGDKINLNFNGRNNEFLVKGIQDNRYSFIDFSYFEIQFISIYDVYDNSYDLSFYKQIIKLEKTKPADCHINSSFLIDYLSYKKLFNAVFAITAFLITLCTAFSIGSVFNIIRISITSNSISIGIMKALGINQKGLYRYILFQIYMILAIGSIISACVSFIFINYTVNLPLSALLMLFDVFSLENMVVAYHPLISLIDFIILGLFVFLVSKFKLKKFLQQKIADIMQRIE